jgi:AraC family transcriptional regulator
MIAKKACCSPYHFQRMFTFMTDMTLSEYIRRRKMTMAAFELINQDTKIIDLAYKFGYESPEALTRAFQNQHGITPSSARKLGVHIKSYPRVSFQLTVKGVFEMEYKIIKKPAFQVYGIERIFDTKDGENLTAIPAFWMEQMQNGAYEALRQSTICPSGLSDE